MGYHFLLMDLIRNLLNSKKFVASLGGVVFVLLNEATALGFDEPTVQRVITLLAAYVVAQGAADVGKERARVEVEE